MAGCSNKYWWIVTQLIDMYVIDIIALTLVTALCKKYTVWLDLAAKNDSAVLFLTIATFLTQADPNWPLAD